MNKALEERSRRIQKILEDDNLSPIQRIIEMRRYLDGMDHISTPPTAMLYPEPQKVSAPSLLDRLNRRLNK